MTGPTVIYGGPYSHESEAIVAESQKETPDFDGLIAGWNTITQGALEALEHAKNPPEPFSGNFSRNVKNVDDEKAEVPPVTLYTTPDENILPQDADKDRDNPEVVVTAPTGETAPESTTTESTTTTENTSGTSSDPVLDKL